MSLHLEIVKVNYTVVYKYASEYFELDFASIRSHYSLCDILTLWGLMRRLRG